MSYVFRLLGGLLFISFVATIIASLSIAFSHNLGLNLLDTNFYQDLFNKSFFISLIKTVYISLSVSLLIWVLTYYVGKYLYTKKSALLDLSLPFFLSFPPLSLAIGVLFLLTPSGFIARFLHLPSENSFFFLDIYEFNLIIFFTIKELCFMIFMLLIFLKSNQLQNLYHRSLSLGYDKDTTYRFIIFPLLQKKLFLPFIIILVYTAGNVDASTVLGNNLPPTLANQILIWLQDSQLIHDTKAAFALILLILLIACMAYIVYATLYCVEKFNNFCLLGLRQDEPKPHKKNQTSSALKYCLTKLPTKLSQKLPTKLSQKLSQKLPKKLPLGKITLYIVFLFFILAFLVTLINSCAQHWYYPNLLPTTYSCSGWNLSIKKNLLDANLMSIYLAFFSIIISFILTLIFIETSKHFNKQIQTILFIALFIPIFLPDLVLNYGFYALSLKISPNNYFINTLVSHIFIVLPYMVLMLKEPFFAFDERYINLSKCLQKGYLTSYIRIKLSLLIVPITATLALCFTLSYVQYTSTLFLGQGRIISLPIETLSNFYSSDKQLIAVTGVIQMILPFFVFIIVAIIKAKFFNPKLSF